MYGFPLAHNAARMPGTRGYRNGVREPIVYNYEYVNLDFIFIWTLNIFVKIEFTLNPPLKLLQERCL